MQRANSQTVETLRIDPGGRGNSIAEQVFRTLRASIVTMRLTPATALSEQDIADRLKLSVKTVESHRGEVMKRLEMHGVVKLVRYAMQVGLVAPS